MRWLVEFDDGTRDWVDVLTYEVYFARPDAAEVTRLRIEAARDLQATNPRWNTGPRSLSAPMPRKSSRRRIGEP